MMRSHALHAVVVSLLSGLATMGCSNGRPLEAPAAAQQPTPAADPARIQAHMAFLASDSLLGREAGSPGYDQAADYVADQFRQLGLAPAGVAGGYFQNVPLRGSQRVQENLALVATALDGTAIELEMDADYAIGSSRDANPSVQAPVVFVGYGIVAPELQRDDYAGLDVAGKIVAVLANTPAGIQSEERAYYGSQKAVEASKRGVIGMVSLQTPTSEAIFPFQRAVSGGLFDAVSMRWVTASAEPYTRSPNIKVGAIFSQAGAEKLFANAPVGWEAILAASEEDGLPPRFEMPLQMMIAQSSVITHTQSANVLAMIEGADPTLKHETLVLSAHLDHIGVSKTDAEDKINNGALDNAAGVATLLETARLLSAGPRPRRTIVFLAVTAEEKGLLGAQYYAKNPTLPNMDIVGNINLDMPLLTYDFTDVIVFGGARSSLRNAIQAAAGEMGIALMPDPFPEQGVFTRGDHFRFVEEGIPAVMLSTGFANGGEAAWQDHFARTYHQPADDMSNNLDFAAAAKFTELKMRIARAVADADGKPMWNAGDFFGRLFDGPLQTP